MKLGKGVVVGDAVGLVLDEAGLEVQWERPRVDLDTLPMGMSDDFRVAAQEGTRSVRISRVIFGHFA